MEYRTPKGGDCTGVRSIRHSRKAAESVEVLPFLAAPTGDACDIRRTFNAGRFNQIANDQEVRPWLGGEGTLDLTPEISNPLNFALEAEGGGFVVVCQEPGIYEVHSLFLKAGRAFTRNAMVQGLNYMFTRTDCVRLVTQVPDDNCAAASLAAFAGFTPTFHSAIASRGPASFLSLSIEDWSMNCAALDADGAWFHDAIEAAKVEQGSTLPDHPHDPPHERAVGAAVRMVRAGNIRKGVIFYNRWARFARYPLIALVSEAPPVFDVGDAIASMEDGNIRVMLCR